MDPHIHLIIHNIVSIVSAISALGVALFLFLNGGRKAASIAFACTFLAAAVFAVSLVVGVNITDPELSRMAFMWNLSVFFVGAFNFHAVLAVVKKDRQGRLLIACAYAAAFLLSILFIILPDLFLLPSQSKMYFPNYYEPGIYNWIRVLLLYVLIIPFSLFELIPAYRRSRAVVEKRQLLYFILTMIVGYGVALIPNFLIYDIPVDPLWGMLFVLIAAVPLLYGAIRYELLNIRIIAKQAFLYAIAVASVGALITLINSSVQYINESYPAFPLWTISLVSAVLGVSASVIVWKGLKQSDILKTEFITTVTHKFRTPLTYIKWATENLMKPDITPDDRILQASYIHTANENLAGLTNLLTAASDAADGSYEYEFRRADLTQATLSVVSTLEAEFKIKKLVIERALEPGLYAQFDDARVKFVIQVFLENALHYSNKEGKVFVSTYGTKKEVIFSVRDDGVGISPEQLKLLFAKFFRSDEARKMDTEGMGIGLYISREIVKKHGGRIWVQSPGLGQGSTFSFSLPRVK